MNAEAALATDTRARILSEAERLFRLYGYSKTTVSDIAEACGMSPSNVYRFFASKSDINEAICERILHEKERRLLAVAAEDAPAADRLYRIIVDAHRYTVETLLDEKKVHEMVVVAMEEQWGVIKAHLDRVTGIVEGVLVSGMERGEFKRAEPRYAAKCVHFAFAGLTHPTMVAQCMTYENRASVEDMAGFILGAVKL